MDPAACSNCQHETSEHDATGVCGHAPCSCITDPRSPVRLNSGPLKSPFSDMPRHDSYVGAAARAAAKKPGFGLTIVIWIALAGLVLIGVLTYFSR